jgi:hypothetical protein
MTDEIELLLFWKGVRDYVVNRDDKEELKKDFAKRYVWELLTKVDTANPVRILASLGRGRRIPSRQSSL